MCAFSPCDSTLNTSCLCSILHWLDLRVPSDFFQVFGFLEKLDKALLHQLKWGNFWGVLGPTESVMEIVGSGDHTLGTVHIANRIRRATLDNEKIKVNSRIPHHRR